MATPSGPEGIAALEARLLADPASYELLWRLAEEYASLAAGETDPAVKRDRGTSARARALEALALRPEGIEGHYWLAVATGVLAQVEGGKAKVRWGEEAWREAVWVLETDSLHAGAHHLLGKVHA